VVVVVPGRGGFAIAPGVVVGRGGFATTVAVPVAAGWGAGAGAVLPPEGEAGCTMQAGAATRVTTKGVTKERRGARADIAG